MKFERTELDGTGNARGTGEYIDYPVQAVYRAIGYFGSALPEIEFDHKRASSRTPGAGSWTRPATTCRASTPPAGSSAAPSA